jgi:hypothetical protein
MTDVLANTTAAARPGTSLTPLVDRLGPHTDVNRQAPTSRPEFAGLLDALTAAARPNGDAPEQVAADVRTGPAVAPTPAAGGAVSAREAARKYERAAGEVGR